MAHPWTPTPVPTATPLPAETLGFVIAILDTERVFIVLEGDSFEQGYIVRLLGVEGPSIDPAEPWGAVALEQLETWLSGAVVRLIQDTTVMEEIDDERVLPRYLYLKDELINLRLIVLGLARANLQEPDTRFETEFQAAAQQARNNQLGLWGPAPTPTPIDSPTATITVSETITSSTPITNSAP